MAQSHPLGTRGSDGTPLGGRLLAGLRHAFAVSPEADRLTAEDEEIVHKVAQGVVRRHLAAPAVMLLESVRPLNFLGSQTLAFFEPIVSVILDASKCRRFRELLEKRSTVPALIDAIEREEDVTRDT